MKMHPSLTVDKIMDAAKRQMFGTDNPGFCIKCGAEHFSCDPDARKVECEDCGEPAVYGASELMMEIAF